MKRLALLLVTALALSAQTPVVLVNGYQLVCLPFGSGSFGALASILNTLRITATFYDTCSCPNCSIEEHAARLSGVIQQAGSGQSVDVIAASMGGLILRSYLAGKYTSSSSVTPPPNPHVRKAVFIATPHFGLAAPDLDARLTQMQPGSRFIWDLATWNQNHDDLRGVDAIAIIGSGGTSGTDDGLVPLTSASLAFTTDPNRTRVIPYCHSNTALIVSCRSDAPPIAQIDSTNHPTYRIIASFLTGTSEWTTIGTPPSGNEFLAANGGLITIPRNAANTTPSNSGATATGQNNGTRYNLATRGDSIYYATTVPAQPYNVDFNGANVTDTINVPAGSTTARIAKVTPRVDRAASGAAALNTWSLAPGQIISIYGADLAVNNATNVTLNNVPATVFYSGPTQVNAILPDSPAGPATLTIQNSKGTDSVRILLEPAVPTLFSANFTGAGPAAARDASNGTLITPAAPATPGQIVAFYATGLGATESRNNLDVATSAPTVTINGSPARVLYAGRAPGYPGLDQINVELPNIRGDSIPVSISSQGRTGNTVTIAIR